MKAKKILTVALTTALLVSSFAGCGTKTDDATAGNKDITKITFWTGETHSKAEKSKYINEWNKTVGKEKGVEIEYVVKSGNSNEAIDLAIQTGQAPHLFSYSSWRKLAENGTILALNDIPGAEKLIKSKENLISETSCAYDAKTDKVYTLPMNTTTRGLIYNKDMFKAAGIVDEKGEAKPPETLEELREDAKKLTDKSKKQFGIILPMGWNNWLDSDIRATVMCSYGRDAYDPVTGNFDYSVYAPAMRLMVQLNKDGSVFPGAETLDNDAARARFAEGNIGMKFGFSFDVGVFNDQFVAKCDWGVAQLPVVDKEHRYKQLMTTGGDLFINAEMVKDIPSEKLLTVLEFFYGDDFTKFSYEKGLQIPCDSSVIESAKLTNPKKNWKEFASFVEISTTAPKSLSTESTMIKTSLDDLFKKEIFGKNVTDLDAIKSMLKSYSDSVNEAAQAYQKNHPEYDASLYIIPDWDVSR